LGESHEEGVGVGGKDDCDGWPPKIEMIDQVGLVVHVASAMEQFAIHDCAMQSTVERYGACDATLRRNIVRRTTNE
jgi:hypothetical protein